ncbi:MAG: exo-alpha-sialidase [Nitrospirae bacterium]|nr:MAG: exo-alpha-sialidase [Nitrospirota bacterium]
MISLQSFVPENENRTPATVAPPEPDDLPLTPHASRLTVLDKFVVHQGGEAALFPGLTRAGNGDLLVSFCTQFDCLPGGEAYVLRSTDEGRTWDTPVLMVRSKKPDGCINLSVGLSTLRNGTLLYPCCDAKLTRKWDQHEADLFILQSRDHGITWSDPMPIVTDVCEPFAYGKIIELSNGDLLCPIWGKRVPDEAWRSGLIRSRDGGRTWGEHVTIGYDPDPVIPPSDASRLTSDETVHCAGFNEATLVELQDGRVLAVLRQQGVEGRKRDLYRSISSDGGRTWSVPQAMPLWGTSPSLHLGPSGEVILGYRNHLGNPQSLNEPGVGISVSDDGGLTWSRHQLLEDPLGHRYSHEFEAGYPAFLNLEKGRVLVLFYSYDSTLSAERYLAANILALS